MPKPLYLQTTERNGCSLRLDVTHEEDRWTSSIGLQRDDSIHNILRSKEGDACADWPPSPPVQEFLHQRIGDQELLLGVGMAGHSHWSVSVSVVECGLEFDVACRVKQEPGWLGSMYSIADGGTVEQTGEGWEIRQSGATIAFDAVNEPTHAKLAMNSCELAISPANPKIIGLPQTVRWRYRIRLRTH